MLLRCFVGARRQPPGDLDRVFRRACAAPEYRRSDRAPRSSDPNCSCAGSRELPSSTVAGGVLKRPFPPMQ